ncbi:MAG: response regulator [Candidatus Omnitrophica bacterium]|nr:response regulator [Candidatus Omnitrophota bacterium]
MADTKNILIFDEDIEFSRALKEKLEAADYTVECLEDGAQALSALNERKFDLVIFEVYCSKGMDGFEFFKEVKKRSNLSKLKIAAATKRASMQMTFESLGAHGFFIKPLDLDKVLEEIKEIFLDKVLVIGDKTMGESVAFALRDFSCKVENFNDYDFSAFAEKVNEKKYVFIGSQFRVGELTADEFVRAIRKNEKNKDTPVIVFKKTRLKEIENEAAKNLEIKKMCTKLGNCDFMTGDYSNNALLEMVKKYL